MAKSKFVAPDLTNATPTFLLDEMGKLSVMEGQIKKMRGVYKEAYYARTGLNVEANAPLYTPTEDDLEQDPTLKPANSFVKEGETFVATTTKAPTRRLDQKLLAEKYPEIFEECKADSEVTSTRFALRNPLENIVVNSLLDDLKAELGLDD